MSGAGRATARGADDWVERVRAASDIVEVIGQTVALRRVGRNWTGLCPFHQEKTPSFSVNAERQFYHCFSCKAGGDVFTYVEETEKVGFLEAVELLSRRAGIPVPERRAGPGGGQRAKLIEALDAAAAAYEQWLWDPAAGRATLSYLEQRGLTHDTIRAFRLGLAIPGWDNLASRLGPRFGEALLVDAGLAARREGKSGVYDRFRHRLMVPLVAPGPVVVGFGARALAPDDQPKYLNSPETALYHKGSFLYGLDQARRAADAAGELIVVEGYFDAIALHQAGLAHTVATSGTALSADQARLLRRAAPRAALTYDGDAAGQDAMLRSLGVLLAEGLDVVVVDLPPQEDPDTLLTRGGIEAWDAVRAAAADPVEFVHRHVLRSGAPGDPRERALQAVVGLGAAIPDPIRLSLLAERAERVLGIPARTLERAVALKRKGRDAGGAVQAVAVRQRGVALALERAALRALLAHPAALEDARLRIGPADFRDPACAALARRLWGEDDTRDPAAEALERELLASAPEDHDWEAESRGAVRRMSVRRLREQQRHVEQQLRHAPDAAEAARLMQTIQNIAHELKDLSGVGGS